MKNNTNKKLLVVIAALAFFVSIYLFFSKTGMDNIPVAGKIIKSISRFAPKQSENRMVDLESGSNKNSISFSKRRGWDGSQIIKEKKGARNSLSPELAEIIQNAREANAVRFSQDNAQFAVLPEIEAVARELLSESELKESLGEFLNYSLLRTNSGDERGGGLAVVLRLNQGTLGVVTGNIKVKSVTEIDLRAELAEKFNLEPKSYFPDLKLSFLSAENKSVAELLQMLTKIRSEPEVESVTLDIIERLPAVQVF